VRVKIPVFIISFNRLTCLQRLVAWLDTAELAEPIIIDNGSTYGPLLEWLDRMGHTIRIHRFKSNYGPYRVWEERLFEPVTTSRQPFYAVTDPDVVPIPECPRDALPRLVDTWNDVPHPKIGLSLRIETIPDTLPSAGAIRAWETTLQCQERARPSPGPGAAALPRRYDSLLDTTFQLNHRQVLPPSFGSTAIRLAHPYQADHLGWHLDPLHLSDEDRFYWETASVRASTIQSLKDQGLGSGGPA
jgi:hypothetical protein